MGVYVEVFGELDVISIDEVDYVIDCFFMWSFYIVGWWN